MRLRSLHLLRYGHFTDLSVDLPIGEPDFHMVFGPNEAGKSTAMSAIEDLFFGIPGNSTRNFLHDYGAMRIGAVLERNGGDSLNIRRRKGNKDTLLTPTEVPVPAGDAALAPFLGGADRAFFGRMFCLDHERLRKGGRDILEARDDVGQMLFSAGAGIIGLREQLIAMQSEADGLWASRRAAHRQYYQAEDRLKSAETALREHTVTSSKWQDLKTAYERAKDACEVLEKEIESETTELRKMTRIRRVCRAVRRHAEVDAAIKDLGAVAPLPEDASVLVEKAAADDAAAATRINTLTEQIDSIRIERAALSVDETLLQRESDIEQLHERRIQIRAGKADLPKRRAELAAAEANLRRIAAELEWTDDDIDRLIIRIPARAKVATVRTLLNSRGGQLAALTSATTADEEADHKLAEVATQVKNAGAALDVSKLAVVIKATRELGDLDGRISGADREVQDSRAVCQRRLSTMSPAPADEALLTSMRVPAAELIAAHRDSCRDLERRFQTCHERMRAAEQGLERDRKAYARIVSDEQVASPEELSRLRNHRDAGWSIIRRQHVDGLPVPDDDLQCFGADVALPEAYEAAVQAADVAADQRFDKAEAAARLVVLSRQIADQQDGLDSLHAEKVALAAEREGLNYEWGKIWASLPVAPLQPDDMLEWLAARSIILDLIERRDTAERLLSSLRREEAAARECLCAQLGPLGIETASLNDLPLRGLIEAAEDIQRREQQVAQKRRDLDEMQRQAEAEAERKRKALKKAKDEWAEWSSQWTAALATLGLSETSAPETVQAQINAIDEMRESIGKINDLRHERIGKIERDIAAFAKDVRQLVLAVASQLAANEPEEFVLKLEHLLKNAVDVRNLIAEKDGALASLQQKVEACELSRREAHDVICKFQIATGVESLDELRTALAQSERLRALKAEFDKLSKSLSEDGDGLAVGELADECAHVDVDHVAAREQTLDQQLQDLRNRFMEANENRSNTRREFEAVGGGDQAASDAADRQAALAEIGEIATQYIRVRSASLLLQWLIDRFRREKQAPILKRAGELFSILTSGSFDTLMLEFDDKDNARLAGIRRDGEKVQIPALSTGAGDQLYLALRIAAVEEYLEHATPLPFIADDLFINYDDDRAAAGFNVLAHVARKTQVLFFTHHQHLLDVARKSLGGSISVVSLGPRHANERSTSESANHHTAASVT